MKRIGVLTGGGDAPGLNAVIRSVVKTTINIYGCEVIGIRDGFDGFFHPNGITPLGMAEVKGILPRGGTILGTANRGNPFARTVIRNGKEVVEDVSDVVVQSVKNLNLDALIVLGGDGTLRIGMELFEKGVPIIGVPKTIDNDVGGTEVTFGFDTALMIATEALDRLHTTAEAHHRAMILELMGRDAGFIALHAGLAGGADVILIPEIPFMYEKVLQKVNQRIKDGNLFSILAVSEGARATDEEQIFSHPGSTFENARLGGIGWRVGEYLDEQGLETRVTVLGHVQRGGIPTAYDRWLATRFGAAAVRLAEKKGFGRMVALKNSRVEDLELSAALKTPKRVDLEGDAIVTAHGLGVSFGI